jgi:hypothetical protein
MGDLWSNEGAATALALHLHPVPITDAMASYARGAPAQACDALT